MRTISLRKFRDSIADEMEEVEVARRDRDGTIQILGRWTPAGMSEPHVPRNTISPYDSFAAGVVQGAEHVERAAARFGASRPAPKGKAKR